MPLLIIGGVLIGILIALQILLFRSPVAAAGAAIAFAAAAYFLTRGSLYALADSIRHNLSVLSMESGTLYREIDT